MRASGVVAMMCLAMVGCDGAAEAEPSPSDVDYCAQAPVLTWDNFGEAFLLDNCASCHASTSQDRHEAPTTVAFDSIERVTILRSSMLRVATGEAPAMPPAGGVSATDRALLAAWLLCGLDMPDDK